MIFISTSHNYFGPKVGTSALIYFFWFSVDGKINIFEVGPSRLWASALGTSKDKGQGLFLYFLASSHDWR